MANRSGEQHPVPKLNRTLSTISGAPRVQYATTSPVTGAAAEGMMTLGDTLRRVSARIEDRLDARAKIESSDEGTIEGGKPGLPERKDDSTIRGHAFNLAAQDAVAIRFDLDGRQKLSEYEEGHQADPAAFRAKADSYLNGQLPALQKFDPALAQRYAGEYKMRAQSAEERIKNRQMTIVRDQQMESALRYQLSVQDEIAVDAGDLFTAGPQEAQKILARMTSNAAKLIDTAHHIGPDGQPLFSARDRIMAERQAETILAQNVGTAWMQSQPDMLTAWESWQKGGATIELAGDDGVVQKVNLKEIMGPSGYQAAGDTFMETLRSELSLRNQIDAAQDRDFKNVSDQTFADLSVRAQEGALTLAQVEQNRQKLEPDRYLTLRELAKKGGASVSDGKIYSDLAVADSEGQDIRPRLRNALSAGTISRDDYLQLYERNAGRVERGTKDSVSMGRDYLTQSLGALSKELGVAQSAGIGQANAEYEIEVQDFIEKNGRQPNHKEARDIGNSVRKRFSATSVDDSLLALELPKSMTAAEKLSSSTSSERILEKIQAANKEFLVKHNGDKVRRNVDPEYLHEIKLLKNYYDLIKLKEEGNYVRSSGTK